MSIVLHVSVHLTSSTFLLCATQAHAPFIQHWFRNGRLFLGCGAIAELRTSTNNIWLRCWWLLHTQLLCRSGTSTIWHLASTVGRGTKYKVLKSFARRRRGSVTSPITSWITNSAERSALERLKLKSEQERNIKAVCKDWWIFTTPIRWFLQNARCR